MGWFNHQLEYRNGIYHQIWRPVTVSLLDNGDPWFPGPIAGLNSNETLHPKVAYDDAVTVDSHYPYVGQALEILKMVEWWNADNLGDTWLWCFGWLYIMYGYSQDMYMLDCINYGRYLLVWNRNTFYGSDSEVYVCSPETCLAGSSRLWGRCFASQLFHPGTPPGLSWYTSCFVTLRYNILVNILQMIQYIYIGDVQVLQVYNFSSSTVLVFQFACRFHQVWSFCAFQDWLPELLCKRVACSYSITTVYSWNSTLKLLLVVTTSCHPFLHISPLKEIYYSAI